MQIQDAFALFQKGQFSEAEAICRTLLRARPDDSSALHLSGLIAYQRRDLGRALELLEEALRLNPTDPLAQNNAATALVDLGRYGDALEKAEAALALKPAFAAAHNTRGNALRGLGKLLEALASYDQAISLNPSLADAYNNRGLVLSTLNREPEALESFDRALALNPARGIVHNNRAVLLEKLQRGAEAAESWDRAIAAEPDNAHFHNGRGGTLGELQAYEAALESYDRAIALAPDFAQAFGNRGLVLHELGRPREAIESYTRAIALNHSDARMTLGMSHLQLGELDKGWPAYEWRLKKAAIGLQRNFTQAQWTGAEPLAGKTILLHSEQGYGDTLQFCRYAKLVAARGARVVLEVLPPLASLLAGLEGVDQVVLRTGRLPDFDFHSPLMSLPWAFGTTLETVPAEIPYLTADPALVAAWRARLGEKKRPRIGLTWSGNPQQKNNHDRSIPLAELAAALPAGLDYIALQKDITAADRAVLATRPDIRPLGETFGNFSDTAAVCALTDRVVSVCTSIAHLAGAMGKPTDILLRFSPCWRWMLDRTDSPWYPTARLYRQKARDDWSNVLKELSADLGSYL